MKKILIAAVALIAMLSLTSCSLFTSVFPFSKSILGADMNRNRTYSSYPVDFENTRVPLGTSSYTHSYFLPTEDRFYYLAMDMHGDTALYFADENGTQRIIGENDGLPFNTFLDWKLVFEDSKLYFTAYMTNLTEISEGALYCYDESTGETELLAQTNVDYDHWDICDGIFVYTEFNDNEHEYFPHHRLTAVTLDLESGESTQIATDSVLAFNIVNERVIFLCYNDDEQLVAASCDLYGSDMEIYGTIEAEFAKKYAYIEEYHITEDYIVLVGDTGIGYSETDVVVYSIKDNETYHYEYPMISSAFAMAGEYGYICFAHNVPDVDDGSLPESSEGIYSIELSTGNTQLVTDDLVECFDILALDEDTIYTVSPDETWDQGADFINTYVNYRVSRIKAGEHPAMVYSYKE